MALAGTQAQDRLELMLYRAIKTREEELQTLNHANTAAVRALAATHDATIKGHQQQLSDMGVTGVPGVPFLGAAP